MAGVMVCCCAWGCCDQGHQEPVKKKKKKCGVQASQRRKAVPNMCFGDALLVQSEQADQVWPSATEQVSSPCTSCMRFDACCCGAGDAQGHGSSIQRVTDGCSHFRPDWAAHQPHPGKRLTRQVWHSGACAPGQVSDICMGCDWWTDCEMTMFCLERKMLPAVMVAL